MNEILSCKTKASIWIQLTIMTRWWVKERTMIVVVLRVGLLRGHCEIYLYNLWVAEATFNRPETLPPQ